MYKMPFEAILVDYEKNLRHRLQRDTICPKCGRLFWTICSCQNEQIKREIRDIWQDLWDNDEDAEYDEM